MSIATGSESREMRAAAAVAMGMPIPAPGGGAGPDPARVAAALRRNKVPLRHIPEEAIPPAWREDSGWREAAAREAQEQEDLRAELVPVCADLRGEGITPILFKTPGGIPYRSSNVDLLVRPSQFGRAATLLERAGHIRLPHYHAD